jgi:hypothetical protein
VQSPHEFIAAFEQVADARIGKYDRLGARRLDDWFGGKFRQVFEDRASKLIDVAERAVVDSIGRQKFKICALQIGIVAGRRCPISRVVVTCVIHVGTTFVMARQEEFPLRITRLLDACWQHSWETFGSAFRRPRAAILPDDADHRIAVANVLIEPP